MSKVPTHFTLYQTLISKLSDYYTKPIQDVQEKVAVYGVSPTRPGQRNQVYLQ